MARCRFSEGSFALLLIVSGADRLLAQNSDWPSYHGNLAAHQYVPHDQIRSDNLNRVQVAWTWDSPDNPIASEDRRLRGGAYKSTPIKVGDRLFVNTSLGQSVALDPATGKTLWRFDSEARKAGRPTNSGFNTRGVGYWGEGKNERILQTTTDSRLWALDARTGEPIGDFGDGGQVDLLESLRRPTNRRVYSVAAAPLVIGDVVVVGSVIFDGPTRKEMPPGDVRAFDVRTGKLVWTFHNPPIEGELGYETWEDGSADYTGNANIWTNLSADAENGLVYLPFGTPTNDWFGGHRKGDGLFGESIVCVRAATGERVWHYQLVHHGLWDYDLPAAPTLFDAKIDGRDRKAIAVTTKHGFLFVFDRLTGEPIWPIEERPVPQSNVPGEKSSPTQPFPSKPPPFDSQGISPDTVVDFNDEIRAEAEEILESYTTGPLFTPPTVITEDNFGTVQHPGWGGGASWGGASYDPETSFLYVPSFSAPMVVGLVRPDAARSNFDWIRGAGIERAGEYSDIRGSPSMTIQGPRDLPIVKPPYGRITAYDLTRGDLAWQVPNGQGIRQKILDAGLPDPGPVGTQTLAGPLLTKSLLFFTERAASNDDNEERRNQLLAYDKSTGELVGTIDLPAAPSGTPMSYLHEGRQYLVVATGGGEKAGLVAVSLGQ